MARKMTDAERCAKLVSLPPHYLHSFPCSRRRGYGPGGAYCKQHAAMIAHRDARVRELKERS